MQFLLKLIKGVLIGMTVVIPGVSGGSMAISLGVYDQIIDFLAVRKGVWRRGRALLPYALGVLLGVAVFAYFIEIMFSRYPFRTACFFVGLILGILPTLLRRVRGSRFQLSHAVILIATVSLMVLLPLASSSASEVRVLLPTFRYAMLAVLLGLIGAATMIVPGISGSMLMMVVGYYQPLINTVNTFTSALLHLDFAALLQTLVILVPFALGVALGMVSMARGIRALLQYYPLATYYGIIGLVVTSPFAIFYQQSLNGIAAGAILMGVALAAAGFAVAMILGREKA